MNEQALIIDEPRGMTPAQQDAPANDLRHAMMTLPIEDQNKFLAEYKERRDNFREWLLSQLVEGTHFGYPPGCEPKPDPEHPGCYLVWMKGGYKSFPKEQWQPKPELYKAGAQFLCDILRIDPKWQADIDGWKQLGSPSGTFVYKCDLYSTAGVWLGEGRGARKVGTKGGDENNGVKMAMKSALVDAVMNTYRLGDLFLQDIDQPPPHDNPPENPAAPKAAPRAQRQTVVTEQDLAHLTDHWKAANPDPEGNLVRQGAEFKKWVIDVCDRVFNARKLPEWTMNDYAKCCTALGIQTLAELKS